ncbi:MauE/DoxX family redox-associated membrane protein [Actinoplanes sp. NPDC051861]|uniref:MauE/DoxX family redox-associated membrane protein n=1 Tax=Actinoplanes sp. NPDC051861 TaxID=3155170 RepID=UPI003434DC4E
MSYFVLGSAIALAVVFLVSGISKVRDWPAFLESTAQLLPPGSLPVTPVAWVVVVAEFAAVALMPVVPALGLGLAALLLIAFGIATAVAVRRGQRAACRCFGALSGRPLGVGHVVRNGVLAVLALSALLALFRGGALHPAGIVLAVVGGSVVAALVVLGDDIADLFVPDRL